MINPIVNQLEARMKPTPKGWPRISSSIYYEDPAAAIDWLAAAFGFEVRLKVEGEGGSIVHSELTFGDGMIMVGGTGARAPGKEAWQEHQVSPRSIGGGNTQALCLFVDDVDAHCEHARKAGAKVVREPETSDYGEDYWADRSYGATDPEGHMWWFMKRVREPHDKG
jgi:uncharacterized glyoxalase superfamily protein PhnB